MTLLGSVLGWIGSWLVKGFGNSVLGPILKAVENGQNAGRDVAVSTLQAEMAANTAKAAIAPAFKPLIYAIGLPAAFHWSAIIADSIPWPAFSIIPEHQVGSWKIGALPADYVAIEATILVAFFVSSPLTTLARAGAARLLKA